MAKLLTNSSLLGGVDAFLELSVKKDVICLTRDPVGLEGVCTAGPCSWIKTLVSAYPSIRVGASNTSVMRKQRKMKKRSPC